MFNDPDFFDMFNAYYGEQAANDDNEDDNYFNTSFTNAKSKESLYERLEVIASNASATAAILAKYGISLPLSFAG